MVGMKCQESWWRANVCRWVGWAAAAVTIVCGIAGAFATVGMLLERRAFAEFCAAAEVEVLLHSKVSEADVRATVSSPLVNLFGVDAFRDADFIEVALGGEFPDSRKRERAEAECLKIFGYVASHDSVDSLTFDSIPANFDVGGSLAVLAMAPGLKQLFVTGETLDLSRLRIDGDWPRLERFTASVQSFDDSALELFRAAKCLKSLCLVSEARWAADLSFEELRDRASSDERTTLLVTDAGLKSLERLPQLNEVELEPCFITDSGMDSLSRMGALERVVLTGGRVSKNGVAALRLCRRLKHVCMASFKLEPMAVDGFAFLPEVEYIAFFDCDLTASDVGRLVGVKKLKVVRFGGCVVDERQIEFLRAASPHLTISLSECSFPN